MNAEQPYGMDHHAPYMAQGAYDPYGYSQKSNFMLHQGIKSKLFVIIFISDTGFWICMFCSRCGPPLY